MPNNPSLDASSDTGKTTPSGSDPDWRGRFTVLEHDYPFLHWDLLLQRGAVLWTWRLLAEPGLRGAIAAERLPDHRPLYLDYTGPVRGDRGHVAQWDTGTFVCLEQTELSLTLRLISRRMSGLWRLQRSSPGGDNWTFFREPEPAPGAAECPAP